MVDTKATDSFCDRNLLANYCWGLLISASPRIIAPPRLSAPLEHEI